MYTNIPERAAVIRKLIENIGNEPLLTHLKGFGTTDLYINNCKTKFSYLETLIEKQHSEQQDKRSAYSSYNKQAEICNFDYRKTLDFVRLKIKYMDGAKERINTSSIPTSPAEKMFDEILKFYKTVLKEPELVTYLNQFNITPEIYIKDVEEAKRLRAVVQKEKGEAEDATEKRNKALVELEHICNEIRTIAKYALKDDPQLLEKLGIKVK